MKKQRTRKCGVLNRKGFQKVPTVQCFSGCNVHSDHIESCYNADSDSVDGVEAEFCTLAPARYADASTPWTPSRVASV